MAQITKEARPQEEVVRRRIHINTGVKCLNSAEFNLVDAFALEDEGIADFIHTSTKEVEEIMGKSDIVLGKPEYCVR